MERNKLVEYLKTVFASSPMEPMATAANIAKMHDAFKPTPAAPAQEHTPIDPNDIPPPAEPLAPMPTGPAPVASPNPAPQPDLGLPAGKSPVTAPAPSPTMNSVLGPEYNDEARRRMYDMIADRGRRGLVGSAFAGIGDVLTNAYGKGGQNTMPQTLERSAQNEKDIKGEFEAGRKGKMEEFATNQALKKSGREEQEYNDQNDPNSQMSKLSVGFAAKMLGPEKIKSLGWEPGKTAYADVSKVLPIIEKYVAAENARADKSLKHSEKEDQYNNTKIGQWRGQLQGHEVYKNWAKIQTVKQMAEASVKDPSPYGDLQLIYSTITAFDPESTVREGELQLFKGAQSVKQALSSALRTAYSGKRLDDSQRANILALINNYDKSASEMLKLHAEPLRQQMDAMKLPMSQIDPTLSSLYQQKNQPEPKQEEIKEIPGKGKFKKVNGKWYAI